MKQAFADLIPMGPLQPSSAEIVMNPFIEESMRSSDSRKVTLLVAIGMGHNSGIL